MELNNFDDFEELDSHFQIAKVSYDNEFLFDLNMVAAKKHFMKKNFDKTVYHLTECHGSYLRHLVSLDKSFHIAGSNLKSQYLTFDSDLAQMEAEGLLRRLREMPSEWTVVQLTRCPLEGDRVTPPHSSPKLKDFFLCRLPCGSQLENGGCLVPVPLQWPQCFCKDLLDIIWEAKEKIASKSSYHSFNNYQRCKAAKEIQDIIEQIGDFCFMEWQALFLGRLYDESLEKKVRKIIDAVLNDSQELISEKERYICYLIAEACFELKTNIIQNAMIRLFPLNKFQQKNLGNAVISLREKFPQLENSKRHPVLLIVDKYLDIVPWEMMAILKNHPVSRVPSIHILHALFKFHEPFIVNGLREIYDDEVSYYVINPDGDLPEEKLRNFLSNRLPNWKGFIGRKLSVTEWIEALSTGNTFIYCGHGSGQQYLRSIKIQTLNVKSVQLLFGCESTALPYLGGPTRMLETSTANQYIMAGSACTLGMLYPVMNSDTDNMTITLANIFFPGRPLDLQTLEPHVNEDLREPELLRTLKTVRECCILYSNGAAFVARGLPVKLVEKKERKK